MTSRTPPAEHGTMSFREHLIELRSRVLRASIGVVVAFFVAWAFHVELYAWLSAPVRNALADNNLYAIKALQITESIEVYMKLSLVGGIFLASPWVFYQVWAFVAPGLLDKERRLLVPVLSGSVACFVLGAAFCYLVVLPFMTDFLIKLTVEAPGMTLEPTLASTVAFSTVMLLAFGAVFELPLFMYVLAVLGLVTPAGLLKFYRYWIVISFIIGAVLTPTPDPINQSLMSLPLVVLYGVGIGVAWLAQRDPDRKMSRGAIAWVSAGLVALAAAGVAVAARPADAGVWDDLPADARQLVGVHKDQLARLLQQAERELHTHGRLAPLSQLRALEIEPKGEPFVVLVRGDAAAALVLAVDDPEAVVRRLSKRMQVSAVQAPSGLSAAFGLPGSIVRWRAVAAGKRVLWLGDDTGVAMLNNARTGRAKKLLELPGMAETIGQLRGSGPVWSLAAASDGVAGWLPAGALKGQVAFATAQLGADKEELSLRYECRGPDAAAALRDRLDAWVSDERRRLAGPAWTVRERQAASHLAELAVLVARTAEAAARVLPVGSTDHQSLMSASHEAMRLSRDASPTDDEAAHARQLALRVDSEIGAAILPPATASAQTRGSATLWTVQAPQPRLLGLLLAPSDATLALRPPEPVEPVAVPRSLP
ncbi:MAG: twin-arginine translocase subunit TatC [Deltaproteobacteria bacterium]|nr:twin-arginine translocase subunit TatC [Deltaproteobacteria bacterium]